MNNTVPSLNEIKAANARAFGSDCAGAQRYDAAVMLSFVNMNSEPRSQLVDVFLDRDKALELHAELGLQLARG